MTDRQTRSYKVQLFVDAHSTCLQAMLQASTLANLQTTKTTLSSSALLAGSKQGFDHMKWRMSALWFSWAKPDHAVEAIAVTDPAAALKPC